VEDEGRGGVRGGGGLGLEGSGWGGVVLVELVCAVGLLLDAQLGSVNFLPHTGTLAICHFHTRPDQFAIELPDHFRYIRLHHIPPVDLIKCLQHDDHFLDDSEQVTF
jgi:hypothetical protein